MKKFAQKMGIIAASGLIFGGLAGGAFVGVKTGGDYLASHLLHSSGVQMTVTKEADKDQVKSTEPVSVSKDTDATLDVADLVDEVMPSVVSITSETVYRNPYAYFFGGSADQTVHGAGSGVIIGEDDDRLLIVTNNHVVDGTESLTVGFVDDTSADATVVGTVSANDLAVVAVNKADLSSDTLAKIKQVQMGESDSIRVGEGVVAIGNALGYGQSVTVGHVSALDQDVTIKGNTIRMLQTDAAINEGNSGGALFDLDGKLVGINAAKATNYDNNVDGMGYAIPIADVIPIVQGIVDNSNGTTVTQTAYLGIRGKDLSAEEAKSFNMPEGIYLAEVVKGSAAEAAGLRAGDIVTGVDGHHVTGMVQVQEILATKQPGDTISVTVQRADGNGTYNETEVQATLTAATE